MKPSRFPDFARGPDGKCLHGPNGRLICRGCKTNEVPKGRHSWCSRECVKRFHPFDVKQFVWERDAGKCVMCQTPTRPFWRRYQKGLAAPEFDHILPHSEGGLFVAENVRLLCSECHKERTKLWHKERTERKRLAVQSEFKEIANSSRACSVRA